MAPKGRSACATALLACVIGVSSPAPREGSPPKLRRSTWPGAVTVVPRPAPDAVAVPRNSTLWFELEPGRHPDGVPDPIDLATLDVTLVVLAAKGGTATIPLIAKGRFTESASGTILDAGPVPFAELTGAAPHPLGVYVELEAPLAPLAPATRHEVRIAVSSRSGRPLDPGFTKWTFTTRAAARDAPVVLAGDAARRVKFAQRVFSGTIKPNFDSSLLFGQLPVYESMEAVKGPPPAPVVGSLQRDWPMCGDYWTNLFFDGDPNLVRERETRRVTRVRDVGDRGLEVAVADLPEGALYGIAPDRPLAPDYPVGCEAIVVDDRRSFHGVVVAVDEAQRVVRLLAKADVAAPPRAADLHLFEPPPLVPDSPETPGHFPSKLTRLVKLAPHGTPVFWFERLDHEWDLVHGRFGRRLVVNFDRVPCDLSRSGVPGRSESPKDWSEWHDVVHAITSHLIERYGERCLDFYWSIANEPDLRPHFWSEDDAALLAWYDVTADALLRAFEDHELDSEKVKVGGLELGALVPQPELLVTFLEHCSPRKQGLDPAIERNFVDRTAHVAPARRSRRVQAITTANDGRGAPCDFVSLHQYKHAAAAIEQLTWARKRALVIDPQFFAQLAVTAFESDPEWNPTRDPATRAMFLDNGFWPAWAADWSRRAIAAAFEDPAFARHEALLTVWPQDRNDSGIPALATTIDGQGDDGAPRVATRPKDILAYLTAVGGLGTDYFVIAPVVPADPAGPKLAPVIAGFGAWHDDAVDAQDELGLLIYAHDPLDPENRDARRVAITLRVSHVPLERAAIAPGSDAPAALALTDHVLELTTELPANGFRCFRIRGTP